MILGIALLVVSANLMMAMMMVEAVYRPMDDEILQYLDKKCSIHRRGRPVANISDAIQVTINFTPYKFNAIVDSEQR